jgi:hypothetical protein
MDDDKKKEELEDDTTQENAGATGNGSDDEESKENKETDGNKKQEKTFTQEQVSKMMTKEKNQGRNAAYRDLGIDPKDEKQLAMVKALIESQKSDEQKAAEAKSAQDEAMKEAETRARIAEAKAEAMQLGVKPNYVEDAITLALSKLSEDNDLKTILGEFKTKYPIWFEEDKDSKESVGKKGTGTSVKSQTKQSKEKTSSMGARLAAQRKGSVAKKSYWS